MKNNFKAFYSSPLGWIKISGTANGIQSVEFASIKGNDILEKNLSKCVKQLQEYFSGKRKKFSLHFDFHGTVFQKKVWKELQRIPFGETISYKELAERIAKPTAFRSVANACNKNPLPILIPCHRVIASNKKIVGYSGGIKKKKWLLEFEKCIE